jgi:hypothetical protein
MKSSFIGVFAGAALVAVIDQIIHHTEVTIGI